MNPNTTNTHLLDGICRRGVLVATSVRYWRGCKKLSPEDLGLDPAHVSDRLIQLGHKRLIIEAMTNTVPLAQLMDGQIAALRHWAKGRAREAANRIAALPRHTRRMAEAN